MDSFPPWTARVRKDPLGPTGYYELALQRYRWVERLHGLEHIQTPGAVGTAGEHNAIEIPREVGSVYVVGGPAYAIEGFRYATGATRSALGTLTLDLDSSPYATINDMTVQVQSCSETWATKPALTSFVIQDTSTIAFYSQALAALGGNTWAAEDADFCVAIHGPTLGGLGWLPISAAHIRGESVTEASTDLNATIQADVDLREMFLAEHDSAGDHTSREVAKTWAHIGVHAGGGVYDVLASSPRNPCASVTYVGVGHARLNFTNAFTLSAQPFVQTDFQRLNSGSESDIYASGTPRTQIFTDGGAVQLHVYIYKYDPATDTWAAADADFFVVVHGG